MSVKPDFDEPEDRAMKRSDLARLAVESLTGDDEQRFNADELRGLREDAQKAVDDAVAIFQTAFRKLPKIDKLSQLWKERRIEETDPIWLMVDALSLMDARSQLALVQLAKLYKAHDDMSRYTAQELRQVVEDAMSLREAVGPLVAVMDENTLAAQALTKHMQTFNGLAPELLDLVGTAIQIQGKNNRMAKWEQAAICAGCATLGALAMYFAK